MCTNLNLYSLEGTGKKSTQSIGNISTMVSNTVEWIEGGKTDKKKIEVKLSDNLNLCQLDKRIRNMLKAAEPEALDAYKRTMRAVMNSYLLIAPSKQREVFGEEHRSEGGKEVRTERLRLVSSFLELAQRFTDISVIRDEEDKSKCKVCGTGLEDRGEALWCSKCMVVEASVLKTDLGVPEMSSNRNMRDKLDHFKTDVILPFQAREDFDISDQHLNKIGRYAGKYDIKLDSASKDTLIHIIEQVGLKKLENHINLLHQTVTGKPAPDISHLEDRIQQRHQEVITVYYEIKPAERQHALKPWYLFYQYLTMEEYEVNIRDLPQLKLRDTQNWNNNMMKRICNILKKRGSRFKWDYVEVGY